MTIRLLATVLLATLVTGACAGSAVESAAPTTDATLESLTADDRAEILDLAGRYSHGIDLKDSAAWEGVFTEDGVMELVSQGIEITGEALRTMGAGNADASGPQSRHIPTTFVIEGAGDEATMRSYVSVVGAGKAAKIIFQGRYEDQLRRVGGRWRIAHRRILTDWIQPAIAEGLAARQ